MTRNSARLTAAIIGMLIAAACSKPGGDEAPSASRESAEAFVARVNRELTERGRELSTAGFAYATYINQDTEFLNAKANERYLEYFGAAVEQSKAYENQQLDPAVARER